jgi:hypothetical protein
VCVVSEADEPVIVVDPLDCPPGPDDYAAAVVRAAAGEPDATRALLASFGLPAAMADAPVREFRVRLVSNWRL